MRFHCFYLACGFTIYALTYRLLRLYRFGRMLAVIAATYFILTPQAILYENWLFYTWPVATVLLVAAYALALYERTLQLEFAVVFLLSIAIVCLTRSTFHLVYLVACVGIVFMVKQPLRQRRIVAAVSLGVLSVVGALYLKNLVLFGFVGSSSWLGMNMWKIAPRGQVDVLVGEKKLPALAQRNPFSRISLYGEEYSAVPEAYRDIPAVAAEAKSNGRPNFNHFGYIAVSKGYLEASVYQISHHFRGYARNVSVAWRLYFRPSVKFATVTRNKRALGRYAGLAPFVGPRYKRRLRVGEKYYVDAIPLAVPAALITLCIGSVLAAARGGKARRESEAGPSYAFMVMTVLYVAFLCNSIELMENARFRVMTNPILYVATLVSLREIWVFLAARRRAVATGPDR